MVCAAPVGGSSPLPPAAGGGGTLSSSLLPVLTDCSSTDGTLLLGAIVFFKEYSGNLKLGVFFQ